MTGRFVVTGFAAGARRLPLHHITISAPLRDSAWTGTVSARRWTTRAVSSFRPSAKVSAAKRRRVAPVGSMSSRAKRSPAEKEILGFPLAPLEPAHCCVCPQVLHHHRALYPTPFPQVISDLRVYELRCTGSLAMGVSPRRGTRQRRAGRLSSVLLPSCSASRACCRWIALTHCKG